MPATTSLLHFVTVVSFTLAICLAAPAQQAAPAAAAAPEELRSLGLFVALERVSRVTDSGLQAIPKGALVTLVEKTNGQKLAVFKAKQIPIDNIAFFSKDPALIAAASSSTLASPGTANNVGNMKPGPDANTNETIRVDQSGNVISRSKTTVVVDGLGNSTTIMEGTDRSVDAAAKIAMARERIRQQENEIMEFKNRRYMKQTISGYESKLAAMEGLLSRMKIELARLEATKKN